VTKSLLIITAVLEAATGIALLAMPSLLASLLLGASLDTPGSMAVAHVTGAALLSLGLACWLVRNDGGIRPGRGVIAAMLAYNVVVVGVLVHASLVLGLAGIGLWPAAGLHSTLAVWCVASLGTRTNRFW
jgi:hypothetical protein